MVVAHFEFIAHIGLEIFEVHTVVYDHEPEAVLKGDAADICRTDSIGAGLIEYTAFECGIVADHIKLGMLVGIYAEAVLTGNSAAER